MNIPQTNRERIIIIGGGFGGLQFIQNLPADTYQVILFDKYNYHCFQPLLYQVATAGLDSGNIAYPLRKIFQERKGFFFRMGEVDNIDTDSKIVHTSIGPLGYDHLVLATGSATNFFGNKNLEERAYSMKTIPEALHIRSILLRNFERALLTNDVRELEGLMNIVVVGAGPTGVELAGALAELRNHILPRDYPDLDFRRMAIKLVEAGDTVLQGMAEVSSRKAKEYLEKLDVQVWLNTMVKDFDGQTITTSGKPINAQTIIWAAGVHCQPPGGIHANSLMRGNRIKVDHYNRVEGYDNLYAIGDVAAMLSEDYPVGHPMVAQPAIQQGRHLAKNFGRSIKGKEWQPFKYRNLGTMATIGRTKAVTELPFWKSQGAVAWLIWIFVHLMALVGFRNRLVVFINWTYNFINYDRNSRIIVTSVKDKNIPQDVAAVTHQVNAK